MHFGGTGANRMGRIRRLRFLEIQKNRPRVAQIASMRQLLDYMGLKG
jgi:hypothetical protein